MGDGKLESCCCCAFVVVVIAFASCTHQYVTAMKGANRNLRAGNIEVYDEAVENWIGTRWNEAGVDVFERMMTQDRESGMNPSLVVAMRAEGASEETPLKLAPVADQDLVFGRLEDAGTDYKNYSRGYMLGAELFTYPASGTEYPFANMTITLSGRVTPLTPLVDLALNIPVYKCEYRKGKYCSGSGKKDCDDSSHADDDGQTPDEFTYVKVSWLRSVTVAVAREYDARAEDADTVFLSECGWAELPHQLRADGTEQDKRFEKRSSAEEWCQENYPKGPINTVGEEKWPSTNRKVEVYLRAADDPYLIAGHLTGCDEYFGVSKAQHEEAAEGVRAGMIASAFFLGLFVCAGCAFVFGEIVGECCSKTIASLDAIGKTVSSLDRAIPKPPPEEGCSSPGDSSEDQSGSGGGPSGVEMGGVHGGGDRPGDGVYPENRC